MEIKNFEDVNLALKEVARLSVTITKINGEVTLECNKIKESRVKEIERLDNEKKYIEGIITAFCEDKKSEFADKRSKEFAFGKIGYRISKSVSLPRVKEKVEALISAIKAYGLSNECLKYEESINKEGLAECDDGILIKLGIKRIVKDNFRIEPKIEALES